MQIEFITESIINESFSLDDKLSELRLADYPSEGAQKLLEFLSTANAQIRERLFEKLEQLTEDLEIYVRRIGQFFAGCHRLLEYIVHSQIQHTSLPLMFLVQTLVKKYVPTAEIILCSSWEYNYSILDISQILNETEDGFTASEFGIRNSEFGIPSSLAVLSFPMIERSNVLLHCVVGHEIGRFIDNLEGISSGVLDKELEQITKHWTQEIVSDIFGIHLLGPAYFFAFAVSRFSCGVGELPRTVSPSGGVGELWRTQLALSKKGLNEISSKSPPTQMRLNIMLREIKEKGFWTVSNEQMQSVFEQWQTHLTENNDLFFCMQETTDAAKETAYGQSRKKDKTEIPSTPPYTAVYKSITSILDEIKERIKQRVADKAYSQEIYAVEVEELTDRLVNCIPPNEIVDIKNQTFSTPSVESILNAAWNVYLTRMEEFYDILNAKSEDDKFHARRKLNDLVLKAIEYSVIQNTWYEVKNGNFIR